MKEAAFGYYFFSATVVVVLAVLAVLVLAVDGGVLSLSIRFICAPR